MKMWTLVSLLFAVAVTAQDFMPTIAPAGQMVKVKSNANSTLYSVAASGYTDPYYVFDLRSNNRHGLGYDFGFLLANESITNLHALLDALLPSRVEQELVVAFALEQWNTYLGRFLPVEYEEEVQGLMDGIEAAGYPDQKHIWALGMVLSSFPGDINSNIYWLLVNEGRHKLMERSRKANVDLPAVLTRLSHDLGRCSWFGAWGPRTVNGDLFSGRNLDWNQNTGIAKYKLISVFHPPAPAKPHIALGFAGLYGALTGMSAHLTVHEAGDDNQRETFEGIPWVLRLRLVMERATNLQEAQAVWLATNNTMGMNLAIGSAADRKLLGMETCANYTASFFDNDPREAKLVVNNETIGAPMPNAVWRTNHAYDPTWLSTAAYKLPSSSSIKRYFLLHDTIKLYETTNTPIGPLQAVNITAIPAAKGHSFTTCGAPAVNGSNIISAAYHPAGLKMWVAFENTDAQGLHQPAACMPYIEFDVSQWLSS
eukprot:TRINITY_DN4530_c0_g1_i1.p1 TRINITY_DN4530_c0_g1~~TRINITY_DN4530_c0_g1_i1.p1  ORF type:complete len:483 (+),score=95.83 TRINITY_DN4530_c0_g1_i1:53-1501(+)